jgi:integrase/recombinase XerD
MQTVTLKALLHRNLECIGIYFAKGKLLEGIIRKQPCVKWSKTNTCWYIPLTKEGYDLLIEALKEKAIINNELLKAYLQKKKKITTTLSQEKQIENKKATAFTKTVALSTAWQLSDANTEALEKFIQQLQLKAYSPSTIKTYRNEFMQLLQILKTKAVDSLQADDIKRYMVFAMKKEGISENTAHSRLNALKFYFEQVLGREKFFWEIPRPKKKMLLPKVISEEKILDGLLAVENLKHKTLLLLAYSAGMRVSEVIQLKISDINSDRMQITINEAKGKKDRVVTLSETILLLLREYYKEYKPRKWLFEGQYPGEHYSARSAQTIFKDAYKKLNLPATASFHSLRHSYATHLLENGTDITYIQKLLGHNDIKTTLRYTHVSNKDIGKIESPLDKLMRKKRP